MNWRRNCWGKKEPKLEDLENSQCIYVAKNWKACSERTPRVWLDYYSIKSLWDYWAETLPVWTEGNGCRTKWRKAAGLLGNSSGWWRCLAAIPVLFFKRRKKCPQRQFMDYQGYCLDFDRPDFNKAMESGLPCGAEGQGAGPLPSSAAEAGPPPQWVLKTQHRTKEGDPWASKFDGMHPTRFWTCLRPIALSFFPISPFCSGTI